jgi:exodeoxyribonuclease VII small subunit
MSQTPKFEKQMERLQRIVAELENGDLALEKSVLLYKEGQALAAVCRERLEKARLAVAVRDDSGLSAFPEASGPDAANGKEGDDDT